MNKYVRHLMIAAIAIMFLSSPALACGGMACSPKSCANNAGYAQGCAAGDKTCVMNKMGDAKKGHTRIPGKTSQYVHKILNKGELIGLSDVQRKQINDLLANAEAGVAKARVQSWVLIKAFYGKLRAGGVSDNEIKAYTKRMGELRAAHLQANLMSSVHTAALLSDEQKAKLYGKKKSQTGKK